MPANRNAKDWVYPLLLAAATLIAFGYLATADFSSWDDPFNIWQNPRLNPPTFQGIAYYWKNAEFGLYIPLTYSVWGALAKLAYLEQPDAMGAQLNPWVFHSANIVLHMLSALMVYAILRQLIRDPRAACVGAMLFALHPVQVEAVGWSAGMKDVLSGCLALAAMWQYLTLARDSSKGLLHYSIALSLFILAMLAKPSAMVLPVIAGTIDLMLLRRPLRIVAVALVPWVFFSIACAIEAKLAQPAIGVVPAPLWSRPLLAADSIAFYLYKLVWPIYLGIDYGRRPAEVIANGWMYFTWIIPAVLATILIRSRHRVPALLAAFVIFVASLAPVLGLWTFLFQYFSTTADHYLYLAMLGPALALAWAVDRFPSKRIIAAASLILALLGVRTILQTRVWRNDIALFTHALIVNPDSFVSMNNLGHIYAKQEDLDRAEPLFERAIQLNPQHFEAYEGLAGVYRARGQLDRAIAIRKKGLEVMLKRPPELRRGVVQLINSIGRDLLDAGDVKQARDFFETARGMSPADPEVAESFKLLESRTSTTMPAR